MLKMASQHPGKLVTASLEVWSENSNAGKCISSYLLADMAGCYSWSEIAHMTNFCCIQLI